MKTNKPKQQHYVPKFYLKEFATSETYGKKDKAQIHIYDLNNEKKSIRNIDTVAYERYLYSPQDEKNNRSFYMEDKLAGLENTISKIWGEFVNNQVGLSPSMKKGVALFISTLILRHPDKLAEYKEFKNFCYTEVMKNLPEGDTKFTFVVKGQESVIDITEVEDSINASSFHESMFFIENIEYLATTIIEQLIKKKWSIIASEEKVFITSDRPVIISNAKTGLLGVGSKGVVISLPLSPTRLLILEDNINNEENLTEYPLNKGHSSFYNGPIWSNAYRYVIGHKDTEEVLDEIYNYKEEIK